MAIMKLGTSDYYSYRFMYKGRMYQKSTRSSDPEEALRIEAAFRSDLLQANTELTTAEIALKRQRLSSIGVRPERAQRFDNAKRKVEGLLKGAKRRALEKGIPFRITVDQLEIPKFCPVLGIRLVYTPSAIAAKEGTSASLDRVDNKKGYVKGNVMVISLRANALKRDSSIDELEKLLKYVYTYSREQY